MFHQDNPVDFREDLLHPMGDQDDGLAMPGDILQGSQEPAPGQQVQPGGRFIQDQGPRSVTRARAIRMRRASPVDMVSIKASARCSASIKARARRA